MLAYVRRRSAQLLCQQHVDFARVFHSGVCYAPPEPQPVPISKMTDNFLDGTSSSYLEELERRYLEDPGSVDATWAGFFKSVGALMAALSRPSRNALYLL